MNIEELLQSLPSREDIASAVGWQSRSSTTSDMLPALGLFGTGMLFGAGLALLFAPRSGSEMRRDINEKVHELGTQAKGMVETIGYGSEQHASSSGQGGSSPRAGGTSGGRTV